MANADDALSIARKIIPGVSDEVLLVILWGHTGFPCFFDGDPASVLKQQLEEYLENQQGAAAA